MRKVYLLIVLFLSAFASHAQYAPTRTVCSGVSFNYSDNAIFPGGKFTWLAPTSGSAFTGGSANTIVANATVSISQTLRNPNNIPIIVSYTVTEITSNTTFTLAITVNPTPTVASVTSQEVLNGTNTSAILFGGTVAGSTFAWTNSNVSIGFGPGTGSGNIPSFAATNSSLNQISSTFTVTPTANLCTGNSTSFTIRVDPTKINSCSGTNLNYTNSNVFASANYTWGVPVVTGGLTGGSASVGGTNPAISQTLLNPTGTQQTATYAVTETTSGTSFSITFIVNPNPSVNAITNQIVCDGTLTSGVTFGGSTVANTTYSWSNDTPTIGLGANGTGNISPFTVSNATAVPITATITVTPISNTCNGTSQSFTIVVNPTPVLNSGLNPTAICNNSVFSYVGTSATIGTSFAWARAIVPNTSLTIPNSNGLFPGNSITETITNNIVTAVNVVYTFTLTANGCSNSQNVTVSVNPTPLLTSTLTPSALCSNSVFSYIATSSTPSANFTWSMPAITGVTSSGALTGTGNISQTLVNNTSAPIPVSYYYSVGINGCANSNVFTGTFNVNPLPILTSSLTPTAICTGSTFTYTALANTTLVATSYSWTRPAVSGITSSGGASGLQSVSQTLFNSNLPITPVTYAYTLSAYGCTNTQNVTVNIYPVPVLSSTLVPPPVCSGTVFDYAPTNILPGTNFNWVRTVTTSISNPAASGSNDPAETLINTTAFPVTAGYTYTLITTNGCTNAQTFTVTVNPTPTLSSSLTPPAICTGSQFIYTPQSNTAGTLFSWTRALVYPITNPAQLGLNSPNEFLVNPTNTPATASYNYTLTANGCGNTQSVNVVVNPVPVVAAQTTATCSNMAFSFMPPNVPSGTVYTWGAPSITPAGSVAGGGAQASGQSAISQTYSNQTITAATALYTVVPTASGCSGIPFSVTVTINPVPFVGNQLLTAICSGTSFSFSATNTQVPLGTTYTWFNPALGPLNSLTGVSAQPISQPAVSQTLTSSNKLMDTAYYTVVPATAFCIGNAFSITVPVKPLPVIVDQRDTICSGASFFVSPSSGLNNTTFTWAAPVSTPAGSISGGFAQTLPVSSISQTLLNVTSSLAQTVYTIIPSVANCAGPPFSLIETVSRPIPLFGNIPVQICSGTPFNATPATAPSGTTYTWTIPSSNPTGGVIGVSAASTPQTAVSQTLSNVLGVTDTVVYTVLPFLNNCQGPSFTATISVAPIPRANITALKAVCQNPLPDTLTLNFIGTAPWSFTYSDSVTTLSKTGITSTTYSLVLPVYPATLTNRKISITNVKDYACLNTFDTSTLFQKINPLPVGQIMSTHGKYLCDGINDTLSVKVTDSLGFQWQINGNAVSGITTDSVVTQTPGAYNVLLTNRYGCSDTTANPYLLVYVQQPVLKFSNDTSCINSNIHFTNLTDTSATGTIQWLWNFGNGKTDSSMNSTTTYTTAGNYHLTLKATQLYCTSYQPTILDSTLSISFPIPGLVLPSVSAYKSQPTPVNARAIAGYTYQWTPSNGILQPDSASTVFNYASTQQYIIELVSPKGCVTRDSMLVRVFNDSLVQIFVPQSFTPNGDGMNDILYPYLSGIKQFHFFRVFNRYGKLLFETRNPDAGWDGTVNGVKQAMGVYFWVGEGTATDGSIIQKTGQVLLLR